MPRTDAALHRVLGVLLLALTLLGCVSGAMAGSATAVQHQRHVQELHAGPVAEAGDGMRAGAGHMCGAWTDRCPDRAPSARSSRRAPDSPAPRCSG